MWPTWARKENSFWDEEFMWNYSHVIRWPNYQISFTIHDPCWYSCAMLRVTERHKKKKHTHFSTLSVLSRSKTVCSTNLRRDVLPIVQQCESTCLISSWLCSDTLKHNIDGPTVNDLSFASVFFFLLSNNRIKTLMVKVTVKGIFNIFLHISLLDKIFFAQETSS